MNEDAIFAAALEIRDPLKRSVFLDEACGSDSGLRKQIEELLKAYEDAGSFMQQHANLPAAIVDANHFPPEASGAPEKANHESPSEKQEVVADPVELFLSAVKNCGLIADDQLDSHSAQIRSTNPDSADEVARKFVEKNILTAYQAERLLAGQGEDCILAGRYHILEKIGAGGMGNVFRARDTVLDRIVAVKMMSPHNLSDPDAVARFKREARALAQLALPNVVQAFDSGEDRGRNFLVMEYIQGIGLGDLVKGKGPVPPTVAADYIYQAAMAMQQAHERGLIHRDIKPGNMILSSDGQVKILDLGLAKFLQDQIPDNDLTQDGIGMGTPDYMPPEQFRDARNVDRRADIYSLGCTLYYLIAGQVPFPGSSFSEKVHAHETKQPTALEEHCPQIPAGLALAVERMLAKRPDDRYQRMLDVADALAPYVAGSSASLPAVRQTISYLDTKIFRVRRKRRLGRIGGGAAIVGVIALLIFFLPDFFRANSSTSPGNGKFVKDGSTKNQPDNGESKQGASKNGKSISAGKSNAIVVTIPDGVTVAQDGTGQFESINAALEKIELGKNRILVLDDGTYAESIILNDETRHAGIVLEAIKNARITGDADSEILVTIRDVPNTTIKGFEFKHISEVNSATAVSVSGNCPGMRLEELRFIGAFARRIILENVHVKTSKERAVVSNCTIQGVAAKTGDGIVVIGSSKDASLLNGIVVQDNRISMCTSGIALEGLLADVMVAGNVISDSLTINIILRDIDSNAQRILIVNNTSFKAMQTFVVWDNAPYETLVKGQVEVCNNLHFGDSMGDMMSVKDPKKSGPPVYDLEHAGELADTWHFHHNGRHISGAYSTKAVGMQPGDQHFSPEFLVSQQSSHEGYLQPVTGSVFAKDGAGNSHCAFPTYIGAVAPKDAKLWNWKWTWDAYFKKTLTVSQDDKHEAHFSSISTALDNVQPGMTIRVLDQGVYREQLAITDTQRHNGITLVSDARAIIELDTNASYALRIEAVSNVTVKGFVLSSEQHPANEREQGHPLFLAQIRSRCPGLHVEDMSLETRGNIGGIVILNAVQEQTDAPIVIARCRINVGSFGVYASGILSRPCTRLVIRDNEIKARRGVTLEGGMKHVLVAGNLIRVGSLAGLELLNVYPICRNVMIVNNTFYGGAASIRFWEEQLPTLPKMEIPPKQLVFRNNVLFGAEFADLSYVKGQPPKEPKYAPCSFLLDLCRFDHNARDLSGSQSKFNLPLAEKEFELNGNEFESLNSGSPDFLRPKTDSTLALEGAGKNDATLPIYIGAIPTKGKETWDWDRTLEIQTTNTLTVSKELADGGLFRTINDALKKVQPGMTIRVLDTTVYNEKIVIDNSVRHVGITLEAVNRATLEINETGALILIRAIPDVTIKGFQLRVGKNQMASSLIGVISPCPGLMLDQLSFEAASQNKNTGFELHGSLVPVPQGARIVVRKCLFQNLRRGIDLLAMTGNYQTPGPVSQVLIQNNRMRDCLFGIIIRGSISNTWIVGNQISGCDGSGIQLENLLEPTENILVANNTLYKNACAVCVWDSKVRGKNVQIRNNLILAPTGPDMIFLDSGGDPNESKGPGDVNALLKAWHFSGNWRETKAPTTSDDIGRSWIPPNLEGNDVLKDKIDDISRDPEDVDFLRPAKDSPLAKAGAGHEGLPPYVGAVAPVGTQPWNFGLELESKAKEVRE